jgi:hypothetical protein
LNRNRNALVCFPRWEIFQPDHQPLSFFFFAFKIDFNSKNCHLFLSIHFFCAK